jgi:hypothetical protein
VSIISWFEDEHPQLVDRYKEFILSEQANIIGEVPLTKGIGGPEIGTALIEKTKSGSLVHHLRLDPEHAAEIFGDQIKFASFSIAEPPTMSDE